MTIPFEATLEVETSHDECIAPLSVPLRHGTAEQLAREIWLFLRMHDARWVEVRYRVCSLGYSATDRSFCPYALDPERRPEPGDLRAQSSGIFVMVFPEYNIITIMREIGDLCAAMGDVR